MSAESHTFTLPALAGLGDLRDMRPVLVIDHREIQPLTFTRLQSVRGTLYSGDISVRGLEDLFSIERKGSIDELVSMVTTERDRFVHELQRLRGLRFARIVVTGSRTEIEYRRYRSRISPAAVLGTLASWECRYNLPIVFFPTREEMALAIERWAYYFARSVVRDANNLLRGCRDSTLSPNNTTTPNTT